MFCINFSSQDLLTAPTVLCSRKACLACLPLPITVSALAIAQLGAGQSALLDHKVLMTDVPKPRLDGTCF